MNFTEIITAALLLGGGFLLGFILGFILGESRGVKEGRDLQFLDSYFGRVAKDRARRDRSTGQFKTPAYRK